MLPVPKPPPNEKAYFIVLPFAECGRLAGFSAFCSKDFVPLQSVTMPLFVRNLTTAFVLVQEAHGEKVRQGEVANRGNARLFLWPRNDETRKTGKSCGLLNSSPGGEKGTVNGLY